MSIDISGVAAPCSVHHVLFLSFTCVGSLLIFILLWFIVFFKIQSDFFFCILSSFACSPTFCHLFSFFVNFSYISRSGQVRGSCQAQPFMYACVCMCARLCTIFCLFLCVCIGYISALLGTQQQTGSQRGIVFFFFQKAK